MKDDSLMVRILFVVTSVGVAGTYGYVALRAHFLDAPISAALKPLKSPERHEVTEKMLSEAKVKEAKPAAGFEALDGDGLTHDLASESARGPVVLVFVKDGCPCSVSAQPFFNRLAAAYGESVRFFGVIDGTPETAWAWGRKYRSPFPILADAETKIVKDYEAESSVYVALIDSQQRVRRLWPGHSVAMLNELNGLLGEMTASAVPAIDFDDAPDELMSGCPFDVN